MIDRLDPLAFAIQGLMTAGLLQGLTRLPRQVSAALAGLVILVPVTVVSVAYVNGPGRFLDLRAFLLGASVPFVISALAVLLPWDRADASPLALRLSTGAGVVLPIALGLFLTIL